MATSLNYIDDMPPSSTISPSIKYDWEWLESSNYSTVIAAYIKYNIKASLVSSGEQVRLSEFGCSGNKVKKNKLLKIKIYTIFLAVISK